MGLFKKQSRRRALPLRRGLCNRGDATAFQMFGYSTIVYVFTDWSIQASINDPLSTALHSAVKDGGSQAHMLTGLLLPKP